jgi:hypothetical protein
MRPLLVAVLIACFALAACAENDKRSDDSRFSGFYGGVMGGGQ